MTPSERHAADRCASLTPANRAQPVRGSSAPPPRASRAYDSRGFAALLGHGRKRDIGPQT